MSTEKELTFAADQNLGDINITLGVLESIAAKAASEVKGVAVKSSELQREVGSFLGLDSRSVHTSIKKNAYGQMEIDVVLSVLYGYSVPEIALEVQERVKEQIFYMTDIPVSQVNVHIAKVETEPTRRSGLEEGVHLD